MLFKCVHIVVAAGVVAGLFVIFLISPRQRHKSFCRALQKFQKSKAKKITKIFKLARMGNVEMGARRKLRGLWN